MRRTQIYKRRSIKGFTLVITEAKSHDLQTGKSGLQFSPCMKDRKTLGQCRKETGLLWNLKARSRGRWISQPKILLSLLPNLVSGLWDGAHPGKSTSLRILVTQMLTCSKVPLNNGFINYLGIFNSVSWCIQLMVIIFKRLFFTCNSVYKESQRCQQCLPCSLIP